MKPNIEIIKMHLRLIYIYMEMFTIAKKMNIAERVR